MLNGQNIRKQISKLTSIGDEESHNKITDKVSYRTDAHCFWKSLQVFIKMSYSRRGKLIVLQKWNHLLDYRCYLGESKHKTIRRLSQKSS